MGDQISGALLALREGSKRLNAVTDEVGEAVTEIERHLNEVYSIGLKASVTIEEIGDSDSEYYCRESLAYCRFRDSYRICVETFEEPSFETKTKPWSDCNRETKLKSAPFLPELLMAVGKRVTEVTEDAVLAAQSSRKLLQQLKQ